MDVYFLGTGGSIGIPEIGCQCVVCKSKNPKDKRLRTSILVESEDKRLLIDCGPDFKGQIINFPFSKFDAVLLTHEHYDHVGGLDDLRPFCKFGDVDIYSNKLCLEALRQRMPYCFASDPCPGVPQFKLHELDEDTCFEIDGLNVEPIKIMHLNLPILGYRIGNFAYLTDVKSIPESEFDKLKGLDTLVISALRIQPHISHQSLSEALLLIERIAPREAYLIHMCHSIGLHDEVEKKLPYNVHLAYDGLKINI